MLFLEIILTIHCLLFVSSWLIGRPWLSNHPSLKLKLTRLLLVSCVVSPLLVHCLHLPHKTQQQHHYVSMDAFKDYVNRPVLKTPKLQDFNRRDMAYSYINISYYQLVYVLLALVILFQSYNFYKKLHRLNKLLGDAIPYRTCGRLVVKVSDLCHIPFSTWFFNKAYIVLPISLLSSPRNVKIAISHEGQHHRNGDCIWAYVIEVLHVLFWGNPGIKRWHQLLSELQEFSCDEVLVGLPSISAYDYGHCLFDVVQTVTQCALPPQREIACTVGMALHKQNKDCTFIIRRISMLSNYPSHRSKSWILGMAAAGSFVLAPLCMAYTALGTLANSAAKADISHLDPKLQKIAQTEIEAALKKYHATSAVVAMADPKTGNLLALAEAGNGHWSSRVFAPGSTIKPFIAAAAIDAGKSSEHKRYDCHSPYRIEGETFSDWSPSTKPMTLSEAFAKSSNVCLIQISQETGAPTIRKKLSDFGFDMNSWRDDKQGKLQLAELSVGEIPMATIDSLTKSYAILANKGHAFNQDQAAIINSNTSKSIDRMLMNAVAKGTGKEAALPNEHVAGKTGTVGESATNYAKEKHLSLFAGYLPQYAMVVIIEDGYLKEKGQVLASGGEIAAPVFRQVAMNALLK